MIDKNNLQFLKIMVKLQSQIDDCWKITEDINTLFTQYDISSISEDEVQNVLLGLKTLYTMKFDQLQITYDKLSQELKYELHRNA